MYPINRKDVEIIETCPLCDGQDFEQVSKVSIMESNLSFFSTDFCNQCGFVFRQKRPRLDWFRKSWLTREKSRDKSVIFRTYNKELEDRRYKRYENLAKAFEQIFDSKKMIDIGTGPGTGLKAFKDRSWNTTGIEPDPLRARIAKQRTGTGFVESTAEEYDFDLNGYDVVTLIHTLEHVHSPLDFLKHANRLVKSDGYVYIEVPELMNFVRWNDTLYLEHLQNFTQETLTKLASRVGLLPAYRFYPKTKPYGFVHLGILFQKKCFYSTQRFQNTNSRIDISTQFTKVRALYRNGLAPTTSDQALNFFVPEINDLRFTYLNKNEEIFYSACNNSFLFRKKSTISLFVSYVVDATSLMKRIINLFKFAGVRLSHLLIRYVFRSTHDQNLRHENKNNSDPDFSILRYEKFS